MKRLLLILGGEIGCSVMMWRLFTKKKKSLNLFTFILCFSQKQKSGILPDYESEMNKNILKAS